MSTGSKHRIRRLELDDVVRGEDGSYVLTASPVWLFTCGRCGSRRIASEHATVVAIGARHVQMLHSPREVR